MDLPPLVEIDFAEVNTLFSTMQKRQPFVNLMGFGQYKKHYINGYSPHGQLTMTYTYAPKDSSFCILIQRKNMILFSMKGLVFWEMLNYL